MDDLPEEQARIIQQGMITPAKLADAFDKPQDGPAILEALLDGGFIERYHVRGRRMINPQNVAEHSWRMAAALFYIHPGASPRMVWATLFHDVSERVTGDLPSPVKNSNDEIRKEFNRVSTNEERRLGIRFELGNEESKLLRWLDRYEGALHCLDELEMGNRKALRTLLRYYEYCCGAEHRLQTADVEARRQLLFVQLTEKVNSYLGDQP